MKKDIKKFIKFFIILAATLGIIYFGFIMWVATKIVTPAKMSNLDNEEAKISMLLECKKMLLSPDAWNPKINYNYVYYLKEKQCPAPEKLQNIEEIQKEFCDRVQKEDPIRFNRYVNDDKICPLVQ